MLTSREQLTVVNELIRVTVAIKTAPPYTDPYELTLIKRKLEEDIAFEEQQEQQAFCEGRIGGAAKGKQEVDNVQSGGD